MRQIVTMKWRKAIFFNLSVRCAAVAFASALLADALFVPSAAAEPGAPNGAAAHQRAVVVPGLWDPRRRPERPDLSRLQSIRFLTDLDYPPFDYAGPSGNPTGFNIDLARLICDEMKVTCTIQARPFATLLNALDSNQGDAVIASIAANLETRKHADFSDPYYRTPARFVALADSPIGDVLPELVAGKKIAVVAGTAHEAYLKQMFTQAEIHSYPTDAAARVALKDKQVDLLFGDGIALSFWLNGTDSGGCCAFRGGPFLDSRFFGDGIGIAVKPGNDTLRQAFNWALFRIWEKGSFTDLWLRYFPISPF
jgi:polar amino acid transport system substrate-binding protein